MSSWRLALVLFVLLLQSCGDKAELNADWLRGTWSGTDNPTYEGWQRESDGSYSAITMSEADALYNKVLHRIKLRQTDNRWTLALTKPEDTDATVYNLTDIQKTGFTATNPTADIAQIEYELITVDVLEITRLRGDGRITTSSFKRLQD